MMINGSNATELDKDIENLIPAQVDNSYQLFTISAIEDDLTYHFSSECDVQVVPETRVIHIKHKYLDYATRFLFLINLQREPPIFEISLRDIPQKLVEILGKLDSTTFNTIFTNVVRRILESVNPVYFHTNGIYGKVRWRIID